MIHLSGIVLFLLAFLYTRRMNRYAEGWQTIRENASVGKARPVPVTVVIAARNEEDNIASCLSTVFGGSYPAELLEVIVVDDASVDRTAEVVSDFGQTRFIRPARLRLIHLPEGANQSHARKKEALDTGIREASGVVVLTTDADCEVPEDWIVSMLADLAEGGAFVAGPVVYAPARTLWEKVQALELLGWIGIGAGGIGSGSPEMCNGANLAFLKKAYLARDGYGDMAGISSGDDVFLMMRFAEQDPSSVRFCSRREALVRTAPNRNINTFMEQRKRWASKARAYVDTGLVNFVALAGLLSVGIVLALLLSPWAPSLAIYTLFALVIKAIGDLLILMPVARHFDRKSLLPLYPVAALFQPLYVAFAGPVGLFRGFTWKGRRLRK